MYRDSRHTDVPAAGGEHLKKKQRESFWISFCTIFIVGFGLPETGSGPDLFRYLRGERCAVFGDASFCRPSKWGNHDLRKDA